MQTLPGYLSDLRVVPLQNLWGFNCIDKDSAGLSTVAVIVVTSCTSLSATSLLRRMFSISHFFIFFDQCQVEFGLLREDFCK